MSEEREKARLGHYAKVQGGYAYPSASFISTGVPVLKIQNIRWRDVSADELSYVPIELAQETERFYVKNGDVLISMTGSWASQPNSVVGRVARFTGESDSYLINQRVGRFIITRPEELDSRFLFFTLCDPDYKDELVSGAGGSANQANISGAQIEALKIPIPPIDEQRAIARILGALDDKIELDRHMNRTLEVMAQALFKSWFVDFDPVTAKAAGRKPYGMSEESAALFPHRFEDSELGLIPDGWHVGKVSDLANITSGKRPGNRSQTLTPETKIPLFGGGGVMGYAEKPLFDLPILLTGRVGTLGEIFRITYPCWASDNTLVLLSKEFQFYEYLYFQLLEIDFQSLNRGSTQPLVTQGDLQKQSLLIPSPEVLKAFSKNTSQLFNRCDCNKDECDILSALRDVLLPKLLSGEIRVRQAEQLVAEAV